MENKPNRPWSVTLLAVGVLMFAGYQLSRVILIGLNLPLLQQLGLAAWLPPLLIMAALGQVLGGLAIARGLWQGRPWAGRHAHWLIIIMALAHWFNRLVLAENTLVTRNWAFSLALQIAFWILLYGTPILPEAQTYFGANHDRKLKDTRTA